MSSLHLTKILALAEWTRDGELDGWWKPIWKLLRLQGEMLVSDYVAVITLTLILP